MSTGEWVKALKPGWLGKKFIKAGDVFQLTDQDAFSDKWMEKHEAPKDVAPKAKDVEAEQDKAVREHEEADRIRRGKYTIPAVPRSAESVEKQEADKRKARAEQVKAHNAQADARKPSADAPPARNPPPIDRGSRDPAAPGGVHETSANPSRVDENARR